MKTDNITRRLRIAAALCLAAAVAGLCLGSVPLAPAQLWDALLAGPSSAAGRILWLSRLPRTAACLLAGAALAVSGAVIQNVLANEMASPGIIGVNAGAALAVTVCCALGAFSGWLIAGAAFFGAFAAVLLAAVIAQKLGASRSTVILGGVAVNSCLTAASEAVAILFPDAGMQAADFRVGGFSSVAYPRLLPAGGLILLALLLLMTLSSELDIMALGEDTARSLGLSGHKMRTVFLGLAALLAGAAVSFAGLLGFVGLIVPHIARRLAGSESRRLLPFCALTGAFLVTACDLLARLLFAPYEIPVGILLSFIGGPFFLYLLFRRKGGRI